MQGVTARPLADVVGVRAALCGQKPGRGHGAGEDMIVGESIEPRNLTARRAACLAVLVEKQKGNIFGCPPTRR